MGADVSDLIHDLIRRGLTIATAESLTGGALCARLVDVPGASATVRGGVCSYATELKAEVLGVSRERLAETGPVDREVAIQMAQGVSRLMGADVALSTTGVAGPGPSDGQPAGTVHIACSFPGGVVHRELHLEGNRAAIRTQSVQRALDLLDEVLSEGNELG